jgi:hypothetical protein
MNEERRLLLALLAAHFHRGQSDTRRLVGEPRPHGLLDHIALEEVVARRSSQSSQRFISHLRLLVG